MYQDGDWIAAQNPGAPPAQLSEIAYRRWDLHPVLEANPGVRPELRQWIAQVNPPHLRQYRSPGVPLGQQSVVVPQSSPAYGQGGYNQGGYASGGYAPGGYGPGAASPAYRRQSGPGRWIAGCGCLALVFVLVVVGLGFGSLGTVLSTAGKEGRSGAGPKPPSARPSTNQGAEEHLRSFEAEKVKFHRLAAGLTNNPVAPLVVDLEGFSILEARAKQPNLSTFTAQSVAEQARQRREQLERQVAAAKVRRANKSGSVSEGLVDSAGNGFIDIRWDAAKVCGKPTSKTGQTVGCVKGSDPLTVHLLPESGFSDDWDLRMTVVHELAHVYQRADDRSSSGSESRADRLVARGLFQKSDEKMADCYALTYYNEWSLSRNGYRIGYGYVCNASERQAIRSWAAAINAPMTK